LGSFPAAMNLSISTGESSLNSARISFISRAF
jgi:hypothetical protein